MILGSYYLTMVNEGDKGEGKVFRDEDEAIMAYSDKSITLQARIKVRRTLEVNGEMRSRLVETTVGRIIFNQPIPRTWATWTAPTPRPCLTLRSGSR